MIRAQNRADVCRSVQLGEASGGVSCAALNAADPDMPGILDRMHVDMKDP